MKTVLLGYLCFGASVLLLGGLLVAPKTGWLVRQQAQAALGGRGEALVKSLEGPKTPPKLSESGEVARKLRKLCEEQLKLRRDEEERFLDPRYRASTTAAPPQVFSLYEALELMDQGAQHDPGNAFFPALRAVALLTTHSDAAALAALHQAAQCPRWDDYTSEEALARLAQLDRVQGSHTVLADAQAAPELCFLLRLKALARVATALAAQKERAGEKAAGLVIRHDLRTLGERIEAQGSGVSIRRSGLTLALTAAARPESMAIKTYVMGAEGEAARRRDALAAHRKVWGEAEALALERVFQKRDTLDTQLKKRSYPSDSSFPLAEQWQVGLQLLSALLATLLLGAFFALLAKLSRGKAARPGVRFGLWIALGVVPLLSWRAELSEEPVWLVTGLLVASWLVGAFALWQVWRTTKRAQRWQEAGLVLATLIGAGQILLIGVLAIWGTQETVQAYIGRFVLCEGCYGQGESDPIPWWQTLWSEVSYRIFYALPTLVPLLALTPILAMISRVKRVPMTFGVARGLGRCALPMALVLTIVYAWQVQRTATLEAQLRTALRSSLSQ